MRPYDAPHEGVSANEATGLLMKLSFLDRFLTLWILLAAGLGLGLGQISAVQDFIDDTTVGSTNVLVAIGLIVMMYPPLSKVRWNLVWRVLANWKLLILTTVQNWIIGPVVMYLLAAAFFNDDVGYMTGLSLVGCARCIAMVVVWNALAGGDDEYCAAIVGINSVLTLALYSPYASLFINELPRHMGIEASEVHVSIGEVAKNVGIYMGVPFALALLTWFTLTRAKGTTWYFSKFTPRIGVLTLIALLFTIVVLFSSQSARITDNIDKVLYAAVPLLIYFFVMFIASFYLSAKLGATYEQSVALSFTAASNNFELALAVAVATFGLKSDPALMSVVGALIEIPTMLALVYLAFWFKKVLFAADQSHNGEWEREGGKSPVLETESQGHYCA
uniref:Arsenical-resistance protein n=1 Tax=Globisporangium ultimum (strain ATCC 200006 / CBS 805.95 / DAOM BR144) TaxID=431595 RepID=K3WVI2_GLOUD